MSRLGLLIGGQLSMLTTNNVNTMNFSRQLYEKMFPFYYNSLYNENLLKLFLISAVYSFQTLLFKNK